MRSPHGPLVISLLVGLFLALLAGCAQKEAAPPTPAGIQYEIGQGAALSKFSWYLVEGVLCFDVEVQNTLNTAAKFEVGVQVDDEAMFMAGSEAAKELKAGSKLVYKTQSFSSQPYPKRLFIKIAPK